VIPHHLVLVFLIRGRKASEKLVIIILDL
jgi:hypothetical protein